VAAQRLKETLQGPVMHLKWTGQAPCRTMPHRHRPELDISGRKVGAKQFSGNGQNGQFQLQGSHLNLIRREAKQAENGFLETLDNR